MNDAKKCANGKRVALTGGLCCIELTMPMIDAYNEQLNEILAFHAANFNVRKPIDEQMKKLAFDAYTQGVLDGQKLVVKT